MKFSKPCIAAFAAALGLVVGLGVAGADTSIYGPTGLILNATADVAPVGMTEGTVYYFNQDDTPSGGQDIDWLTINAVGGMAENSEFNIGYNHLNINKPATMSGISPDGLIIGMKFRLLEESDAAPAVAIGVNYFKSSGWYKRTSGYVCATKELSMAQEGSLGIRGTFGLRWSDVDLYTNGAGAKISDNDLIPYIGIEAQLTPQVHLILELEDQHDFANGRSTETPFSACLRYRPTANLVIDAGVVNTGFENSSAPMLGVSYIWEHTGWR